MSVRLTGRDEVKNSKEQECINVTGRENKKFTGNFAGGRGRWNNFVVRL